MPMTTRCCLAGAALALFAAGPVTAASASIAPETILAKARAAYGKASSEQLGVLVEIGTELSSGLKGRWRYVVDGIDGRMHESVDFGPYRLAAVWDGRDYWRQDHSGGVHSLNSSFARANAASEAWLARRAFLSDGAGRARLAPLPSRASEGRNYQRLRATPPQGQPIELWFDQASGLLARSVWEMPVDVRTIRYEDYRQTGRLLIPYRIIRQDGDYAPDTLTIEHADVAAPAEPNEFAAPRTPDDTTVANGEVSVPISYDGDLVVEAMLNGKGPFSFILDTGGHDILTPQAAKLLGIAGVGAGQSGGAGAGTLAEQYTRVDLVEIGGVAIRDQSFIIVPLQYDTVERGSRPPLAGILGVELFERLGIQINYRDRTLTFRPLKDASSGRGVAVAMAFSDDQPTFRARIDGIVGDCGLDTGNSGALVVQGHWAGRNGLAERMRRGVQTAGFGAGGISRNWAIRSDVEVAGQQFSGVTAYYAEDRKGSFASRTEAGNIGNEIYENFTLTFDYSRNLVWFKPVRDSAHAVFTYSRTGMSVYKPAADAFAVAIVIPHGPAAEAGIAEGDRILAVNEIPASKLSGWDMRRLSRQSPGTELRLAVLHLGGVRPVAVALREVLP
jgi:hypothetical protein